MGESIGIMPIFVFFGFHILVGLKSCGSQARAIHELAKRVFHTLKTDPEKFELEFSLTRRRYGRKRQVEAGGGLPFRVGVKLRRNSLAYCRSSGENRHDNEIRHGKSELNYDVSFLSPLNYCKSQQSL